MSKYWHAVISVISTLSYLLKDSDDDGMDLYFAISSTKYNSKKSEKLVQKLLEKEKELVGTSNVGLRLSTILHEYQLSLDPSVLSLRSLLSKAKGKTKKPLSVYILTDAVWQPHCNVAEPIRSLVETLRRWGYSRHQAGIQFIRFGHDSDGIEKLDHLDSGLQLGMYVFNEPSRSAYLTNGRTDGLAGMLLILNQQTVMSGKCSWARLMNGSTAITQIRTVDAMQTK